jgi:hypothetical protein
VIPAAPKDGAAFAGDRDRLAHVVELAQADLLGERRVVGVLEPPQVQRQEHPLPSSRVMSASFNWVNWYAPAACRRSRAHRHTRWSTRAQSRAAPSAPKTIPKRASLRQDSGPDRPCTSGQHRRRRQPHLVEHQLGGDRGPQRQLVLDRRRREAWRVSRHDEPADPVCCRRRSGPRRRRRRRPSRW